MLSDISEFLKDFNPKDIATDLALRAKQLRLSMNLTQAQLAKQSGVSLGSLKRFEGSGEISLQNLLLLAVALEAAEAFKNVFVPTATYKSVDEVLKLKKVNLRKRARKSK